MMFTARFYNMEKNIFGNSVVKIGGMSGEFAFAVAVFLWLVIKPAVENLERDYGYGAKSISTFLN